MIRFTKECDGHFPGDTVTLDGGTEDAYVTWRGAAEYVKPEDAPKSSDAPPADKMVHPPTIKAGESRKGQLKVK